MDVDDSLFFLLFVMDYMHGWFFLNYDPNFQGGEYKPSNPKDNLKRVITSFKDYKDNEVKEKDVKEWAMSESTIDKYKERYKIGRAHVWTPVTL